MASADRSPSADSTAEADPHEHRFGSSPPLSLGVEEELLLVDANRKLVAGSQAVLDQVSGPVRERTTCARRAARSSTPASA